MTGAQAIRRLPGLSVWRQIAQFLEEGIRSGQFSAGARLPTEAELAERFSVNRHTVRQAIAHLVDQGRVHVIQGKGSYVRERPIEYALGRRTRLTETLQRSSHQMQRRLLSAAIIPAGPVISTALNITEEAPVWQLFISIRVDRRAFGTCRHHFPVDRFPDFDQKYAEASSITGAFALYGIDDYVRVTTRISAVLPDAEDIELLEAEASTAMLVTEAVNADLAGTAIEFGVSRFLGDHVSLSVDHTGA